MKLKDRLVVLTVLLTVLLGYLASGFFTVAQDEIGVVLQFGRFSRRTSSGLSYRLPWPVERVYRVKTDTIYPMSIGYKLLDRIQGIPPQEKEMQWLTGDTNLINIMLEIQYKVKDPEQYLFTTEEPRFLVRRAAEAVLTELVGQTPVDELLTRGKTALERGVEEQSQRMLDTYQAGLMIISVNAEALEPPEQVISYFNEVKSAGQERERAMIDAEGDRMKMLAEAQGEAQEILSQAEAVHATRVAAAQADTERFLGLLTEYRKSPAVVREKLYSETLMKLLPGLEMTVVPGDLEQPPQIQIIQQR